MDLRDHFLTIWRRKWAVLAVSAIVAILVYVITSTEAPTYQAQAQMSVIPAQSSGSGQSQSDALFLASTYARLAVTVPVIEDGVKRSGLRLSETTASDRLQVTASSSVSFLTITATGPSPSDASRLAQGEADALVAAVSAQQQTTLAEQLATVQARIKQVSAELQSAPAGSASAAALDAQLQSLYQAVATTESQPLDRIDVVAPARAQQAPVSPAPKRDAALAFVTALVIDAELAVGIEALGDRFPAERMHDEVTRLTGLPVLADVPEGSSDDVVEAFRTLRANLLFLESAGTLRTVAVVSADPAAGKSFAAINLAASVAELNVAVVLIDGDMRRPVLSERMSVPRSPGLSEVLLGLPISSALRATRDMEHLRLLPAGAPVPDPPGLLTGEFRPRVIEPLADMSNIAELVVIDSPAESLFPDAVTIAAHADATLVVIDAKRTRRRAVRATMSRLAQVNARPVGVVVNRTAPTAVGRYRYRYRPGHAHV